MKVIASAVTALSFLLLTFAMGCNKSSEPPSPLSVQELPSALQGAFSKANPPAKALADQVVAFVQAQDYSKAFLAIQNLAATSGLTREQLSVTARATLTVNTLLQEAQSKGDQKAAQTLQTYRQDK